MSWRQQYPQRLGPEVARTPKELRAASGPSAACAGSTARPARAAQPGLPAHGRAPAPPGAQGPRAALARGRPDAFMGGCCGASWAQRHPALRAANGQHAGQSGAVPPLRPTQGRGAAGPPKPGPRGQREGFAFGMMPRGPGQLCLTLICLARH